MREPIILASQSPRRIALLESCEILFHCVPAQGKEVLDHNLPLMEAIEQLALKKAQEVFHQNPNAIVIGADTMIIYQNKAIGKAKDQAEAYQILAQLSGQWHRVVTAVSVLSKKKKFLFHEVSHVHFYPLSKTTIETYIKQGEWKDKAGAYAIQGLGKILVSEIKGDFYNIMGLPIAKVYQILQKLNGS